MRCFTQLYWQAVYLAFMCLFGTKLILPFLTLGLYISSELLKCCHHWSPRYKPYQPQMWNLHTAWMPIFPVGREEEHGTNSIGYRHESESEVTQSRLTLCDPMDCSLPGSSVHGIFQARVLEWVAISFSTNHKCETSILLECQYS